MIYVINYASGRFAAAQRIQNARWSRFTDPGTLTVCSYTTKDLLPILSGLRLPSEDHIRAVLTRPKGDGLWAWKAILIYHAYRHLASHGDIVLYMDSGACPVARLDYIWEHIRQHGHLFVRVSAFERVSAVRGWLRSLPAMQRKAALIDELDFSCRLWTKLLPSTPCGRPGLPPPVLARLARLDTPLSDSSFRLLETEQVCGGIQGYLKRRNDETILEDVLATTSLEFFDDAPDMETASTYIDHRHDQAVLSLIVNAEYLTVSGFQPSVVSHLPGVCLHRGYPANFPPPI